MESEIKIGCEYKSQYPVRGLTITRWISLYFALHYVDILKGTNTQRSGHMGLKFSN